MSDLTGDIVFMNQTAKILTRDALESELIQVRASGKKIVFTNGCFDILHLGHVRYLSAAKSHGDILVVGLNSDGSVQLIKGENRPIIDQRERAEVLAALWFVDYVTLFDETDPLKLIECLRPDVLVKGEDWPLEKIIGADFIQKNGGRVARIPVVPDISTSIIIERIKQRF
jgi:D-beta-D-heptose 7-phosphate kinase/D-beta-D-heptose 1-phosphate adenosyltransferase